MKQKLINELWVMLYQFICVPLLMIFSFWIYTRFIVVNTGGLLSILVAVILVLLNVLAIYALANLLGRILKVPLIYHILTGAITIFILAWVNVYYITSTKTSCDSISAIKCSELINNTKTVKMTLIAFATYFLLYIVIERMVRKKAKKSNN